MTTYDKIESLKMPPDMQGWESSTSGMFADLIENLKPKTIIEVGSWKGVSAIVMAGLVRPYGGKIHCVDTWLGAADHFIGGDKLPRDQWGYPILFHQFLTNVKTAGFSDVITPYPMTSTDGAKWLAHLGVSAQLIYVDGDHDVTGCYADMQNYWPLLVEGGVMFGDDWDVFQGVKSAVIRFVSERKLRCVQKDGFWLIKKTVA